MSETRDYQSNSLKHIIEAALLAAGEPLNRAQLGALFNENEGPSANEITDALAELARDCADRGIELKEVASGFRLQVKPSMQEWVSKLWTERPARYSRALLETLSLIAYRQPITRGEIEAVRGVSVRSSIIRTLQEREWIRIVGHRDVPGKPALFGTTRQFLDYFDLKSMDELPTLAEIKDMDNIEPELDLEGPSDQASEPAPEDTPPDAEAVAAPESEDDAPLESEEEPDSTAP
jgi:segregation and condensation protein B